MKFSLFILPLLLFSIFCFGQKKGKGIIGVEYNLPQNADPVVHNGYGFVVGYERQFSQHATWLINTGYSRFNVDGTQNYYNSYLYSIVPVVGGIRYYTTGAFNGLYLEGDIGISSVYVNLPYSATHTEQRFTLAPALGYDLKFAEISFRANLTQGYPYLGFRLAGKF
jgi:hypothetical protein